MSKRIDKPPEKSKRADSPGAKPKFSQTEANPPMSDDLFSLRRSILYGGLKEKLSAIADAAEKKDSSAVDLFLRIICLHDLVEDILDYDLQLVEAIGRIGVNENQFNQIVNLFKDGNDYEKEISCYLFVQLLCNDSEKYKSRITELASLFLDGFRHKDTSIRCNSVSVLGKIGYKDAYPELVKLTDDNDDEVRDSVIRALGNIGDERAISVLKYFLRLNSLQDVAIDALKQLGVSEQEIEEDIEHHSGIFPVYSTFPIGQEIKDSKEGDENSEYQNRESEESCAVDDAEIFRALDEGKPISDLLEAKGLFDENEIEDYLKGLIRTSKGN